MKKLAFTTAMLLALSTAVSAQTLTNNQENAIMQLVPDADLSNLTTAEVFELQTALGGDDENMVAATVRGIIAPDVPAVDTSLTELQKVDIMQAVPDADLSNLTNAQVAGLQSALGSSDNKVASKIRGILDEGPDYRYVTLAEAEALGLTVIEPPALTDIQQTTVKQLIPDADLSNLTSAQVAAIQQALSGDDSGKAAAIRAALN